MRSPCVIALVFVVVLAGCGASDGTATPENDAPPTTGETNTHPATTGSPTPATADGLTAATTDSPTAGVTPGNTVAFENLSDRQQAAFLDALEGKTRFVPNTSHVNESEGYSIELAETFRDHTFVRYEGRYYRPSFERGPRRYASYRITAVVGSPGPNESASEFQGLPASVRDEIRQAIVEGRYTVPAGKWSSLPDPLPIRYVRYDDETYVLSYAVGDIRARIMTVQKRTSDTPLANGALPTESGSEGT